jgi:glycosyltransferase involved in cell wall biosynthesis
VVTLARPGPLATALRSTGTAVHELGTEGGPATIVRLRRLIRLGRFDVVHTHLYRACVQGRFAARLAGVRPVVATAHHLSARSVEDRPASSPVRTLYLAGERAGQATIAVTPTVAGRLRAWGVPDARITVIPKAVDAAEFRFDPALRAAARARLEIADGVPVVGGVGRLEHGEGFDRLIRAVGELPGVTLLLVGDGPARVALQRLAVIEGLADRVRFAGTVGHAREMLCAMDVFASPSEQETFGLAVLEALACGLPALYEVCPPLDDPAIAGALGAARARRLSRDWEALSRALRTELACHEERGGARLPVPALIGRFDITQLAASVGRLYDQMALRPAHSEGARR